MRCQGLHGYRVICQQRFNRKGSYRVSRMPQIQVDLMTNIIDFIMLKILGIALLVLCIAADDVQVKDQWFYSTYVPAQRWQQIGTYDHQTSILKFPVRFLANHTYYERMKNYYESLKQSTAFYRHGCRTVIDENGQEDTQARLDLDPDVAWNQEHFFLIGPDGRIVLPYHAYKAIPDPWKQKFYDRAKCWARFQRYEFPRWFEQNAIPKDPKNPTEEEQNYQTIMRWCKQRMNNSEVYYFNIRYNCIPKGQIGINPEVALHKFYAIMEKHGDRQFWVKNAP